MRSAGVLALLVMVAVLILPIPPAAAEWPPLTDEELAYITSDGETVAAVVTDSGEILKETGALLADRARRDLQQEANRFPLTLVAPEDLVIFVASPFVPQTPVRDASRVTDTLVRRGVQFQKRVLSE